MSWRAAVERVRTADVAVVINSPGTGGDMAAPSKLYEALALGTPVLALTNPGASPSGSSGASATTPAARRPKTRQRSRGRSRG